VTAEKQAFTPIWKVTEPSERVHAPEWMSFHLYKEAQRCPLSVSLQRSYYRQLWDGNGYPARLSTSALSGIVIHEAAETILKEFAQSGVSSLMEPIAMSVLKELGGFTKVLESALNAFLLSQSNNPRFGQFRDDLSRTLRLKLPQLRATLQALIAGHVWTLSAKTPKAIKSVQAQTVPQKAIQRFPLGNGTFVEVDLEDAVSKWRGRIDVININEHGCSITDLKSGNASEEHAEQLAIYSMLWLEDSDRNPSRLPVQGLQIVYASGAVAVTVPDDDQAKSFRRDLIASSESVRSALNSSHVRANPSRENCRHCSVKLLCEPYWQSLSAVGLDGHFSSIQVTLLEMRGERAWLATVTSSASLPANEKVVVRDYEGGKPFWSELKPGLSIRLTDGLLSSTEASDTPVINLSMMSEALFVVPS
jgi:PD-(D/E)XK nuclease superfamily